LEADHSRPHAPQGIRDLTRVRALIDAIELARGLNGGSGPARHVRVSRLRARARWNLQKSERRAGLQTSADELATVQLATTHGIPFRTEITGIRCLRHCPEDSSRIGRE